MLEPDLFYSAQDRGPRKEHGVTDNPRTLEDYHKFDGQAFSASLYADLLKKAGVTDIVTVHNHSSSVKELLLRKFNGKFYNLIPSEVYKNYLFSSNIVNHENLIFCSPDKGAYEFAFKVFSRANNKDCSFLKLSKERTHERKVKIKISDDSPLAFNEIEGRDVVVLDDMVRTGATIIECCKYLKSAKARKVVFFATHFYSSREGRARLNNPAIDEIVTTSSIPQILNRDVQGRLRHKLVVLQIERWISDFLLKMIYNKAAGLKPPLFIENMSSKNPRWTGIAE